MSDSRGAAPTRVRPLHAARTRPLQAAPARAPWRRTGAAALALTLLVATFATFGASQASAGPAPVMVGYVPLSADDFQGYLGSIGSPDTTLDFTVGVTNAAAGAVIYYDHREDGFESDIANPTQLTTWVFGDGNTGNGNAATYCSVCAGDLLPQGAALIMRNNIATPRTSDIRFDGGDKVASTRGIAITAGGFTTPTGSVLSGVVSAYDTTKYGTEYTAPVGEDTPFPSGTTDALSYTGATIMAANVGTLVEVDTDGDGDIDVTTTLGEGGSTLVDGGMLEGATIRASAPVQVHLLTGRRGSSYEARSFTLFPDDVLSNDYMSPAGSSVNNFRTVNYLYNPAATDLIVTPTCTGCSGTITVPAEASAAFHSPVGQAVRFTSAGGTFVAIAGVGAQSGAAPGGGTNQSQNWDWGFTMIPTGQLTTQVVLGWAPGNSNNPPTAPQAAYDPVWVTTLSATTVHVDYDGNPATGAIVDDDCFGARHDVDLAVTALASTRISHAADGDMTGARIYTCDGTKIAGAWGQDPSVASAGAPGFDAGYTIIPSTTMVVEKSATLATDVDDDGAFGPGDTMTYEIAIADAGSLAFTDVAVEDILPPGLTYVAGSTRLVTDGGTIVIADDIVPPATTVFPLDDGGVSLPTIDAGETVFLRFEVAITEPWSLETSGIGNTACVTAAEANACDSSQTELASADLSLTKVETAGPAYVGEEASFTVTVTNAGPDLAPGVEVTDLLPAGLSFTGATPSQGSYDETTGLWLVGDIGISQSATLEITAIVDTDTPLTNVAEVTGGGSVDPDSQPGENPLGPSDPPDQDDEGSATVDVLPLIDLELTKTVTDGPSANGTTEFAITVSNDGPSTATAVEVRDHLPLGALFDSAAPTAGTFDSGTAVWTVGSILAGESETLVVSYRLDAFPTANFAEVSDADQLDADSQPAENALGADDPPDQDDEAAVGVTSPFIDLSLDKTVTPPTFVGQDAVFEITVTNAGPAAATGVEVTDLLPAGLSFQSASATAGTYDDDTGIWDVGSLTVGGSATLTLTATVDDVEPVTNVAEVSAADQDDVDSTPGNGTEGEDDRDTAGVTAAGASIGDRVWDDVDANGAQDPGEPGLDGVTVTLLRDSDSNGSYETTVATTSTAGGGAYSFGDLGPGVYRVVVDGASVPAGYVPTTPTSVDVPLVPGEVVDTADVGFSSSADLSLTKSLTSAPTYVGEQAIFEITVTNDGPATATGVVVGEVVPAGLTIVSAIPTQGSYSGATDEWTVGTLADGATATLTLTTEIGTAAPVTNTAEVVAADQHDPDSTPNDGEPDDDDLDTAVVDVDPLIDLSLTKTETAAPTHLGDTAVFEVVVANAGPSDATGVMVTDVLPAGLTYVGDDGAGAYDEVTGVWTVGTVASGGTRTLEITAVVDALTAENFAQVTAATEHDGDSTPAEDPLGPAAPPNQDDEDSAAVTVAPVADLSLTKTSFPSTVNQLDPATFRLTLANAGPSPATGVVVTDLLPLGVIYASHTATQGTYAPLTGEWAVGTVAVGASATLDIVVTVISAGPVSNTAEVTAVTEDDPDSVPDNGEPAEDDQDSTTLTSQPVIDLSLTKDVSAPTANVGSTVTYTVVVTNDGPSGATGVEVLEQLPAGVAYAVQVATQGAYDPGAGVWSVGNLAVDASATLSLTVTVLVAGPTANVAEVRAADQTDVDSQPIEDPLGPGAPPNQDDEAEATVSGILIDLELDIAADATSVHVGDQVTYTVTLVNQGPSPATGVTVTDLLPAGLSLVGSTTGVGSFDSVTGVWSVGSVGVGETVTLELTATVGAAGPLTNTAQVSAAGQPDVDSTPANDDTAEDDQDSVAITGVQIDLSLTKTADDHEPALGGQVTYTLTLTNAGPSDATGVVVRDELPAGLEWVADTSGGAYDPGTGLWTVGSLASGASVELDVTARVHATGDIANRASVDAADQPDADSEPGNDDATEDDEQAAVVSAQAGSVRGTIWYDADGDGVHDDGDDPIAGALVLLLDEDGETVGSMLTDADGGYRFVDLPPGTYEVVIDATTLPDTVDGQSVDPDAVVDGRHSLTLGLGEDVAGLDFAYAPAVAPPIVIAPAVLDTAVDSLLAATGSAPWPAVRAALALLLLGGGLLLARRRIDAA